MVLECYKNLAITVFFLIGLIFINTSLTYSEDNNKGAQIICVDSKGEAIANASVTIKDENFSISLGYTNSSGYVSGTIPKGLYNVEVKWKDHIVYSGPLLIQGNKIKVICNVHTLLIKVNFLNLIPIINARIYIYDKMNKTMYKIDKLKIPYGFYKFSAETELKLPEGEYEVIAEAFNSDKKFISLKDDATLIYTNIVSLDAILFIILLVLTIVSLIGFILTNK